MTEKCLSFPDPKQSDLWRTENNSKLTFWVISRPESSPLLKGHSAQARQPYGQATQGTGYERTFVHNSSFFAYSWSFLTYNGSFGI